MCNLNNENFSFSKKHDLSSSCNKHDLFIQETHFLFGRFRARLSGFQYTHVLKLQIIHNCGALLTLLGMGFSLRICEQLTRRFRKSEEVNVDPASIEQISKSEEHTKKKVDTNRLALLCVALKWHRLGILTL